MTLRNTENWKAALQNMPQTAAALAQEFRDLAQSAGNGASASGIGLNVIAIGDSVIGRNYRTASGDSTQGTYSTTRAFG